MQTIDTSIEVFEPIRYSSEDTCATQKRIAEHNSVHDTLKTGERVVYAAPCELDEKSGGAEKVAQAGASGTPARSAERPTGRRPEGRNRATEVARTASKERGEP